MHLEAKKIAQKNANKFITYVDKLIQKKQEDYNINIEHS